MRLSVIIIALNEEQNLPRCLRSIYSADQAGL
jgi:glycosyltransferase involved in cell wall biosynthesis